MKPMVLAAWLLGACSPLAWAQGAPEAADPGARIAAERQQLQMEREAVEREHDERQRACWQRFVVNSCLQQVRRERHAALDPLRARELVLNEQERAWRTQQREQRMREKDERGTAKP